MRALTCDHAVQAEPLPAFVGPLLDQWLMGSGLYVRAARP